MSTRTQERAYELLYAQGEVSQYEEDDVDEYVDLNEVEEIIRQLREDQPQAVRRIVDLRDGIRCGQRTTKQGTVVFCRAGEYRELYLVDDRGEIISRDISHILGLLKCNPDTPAQPLPSGYNQVMMDVKRQFDSDVQARRAEREHTLSLTRAQRYVLQELRRLYDGAEEEDLKQQISVLGAAFRQPNPWPAVRNELNRARREERSGESLLEVLGRIYHLYGLDEVRPQREVSRDQNNALPRIVCSEALLD